MRQQAAYRGRGSRSSLDTTLLAPRAAQPLEQTTTRHTVTLQDNAVPETDILLDTSYGDVPVHRYTIAEDVGLSIFALPSEDRPMGMTVNGADGTLLDLMFAKRDLEILDRSPHTGNVNKTIILEDSPYWFLYDGKGEQTTVQVRDEQHLDDAVWTASVPNSWWYKILADAHEIRSNGQLANPDKLPNNAYQLTAFKHSLVSPTAAAGSFLADDEQTTSLYDQLNKPR